jgi:arginine/lysine/ornithine decarboxylase
MLSTTSPNVLVYAALDGWRRQMVQHGNTLLDDALHLARYARTQIRERVDLPVLHHELLGAEASHDLDELHLIVQVDGLGISGYQAADWLREHQRLNVHMGDGQRVEAQVSIADTRADADRLVDALVQLRHAATGFATPPAVDLPGPGELELEQVMSPREAFFSPTVDIPIEEATGRIAAEQVTPYPPGIPVLLPGERINDAATRYLTTGKRAGMFLPDPADPTFGTVRVVAT